MNLKFTAGLSQAGKGRSYTVFLVIDRDLHSRGKNFHQIPDRPRGNVDAVVFGAIAAKRHWNDQSFVMLLKCGQSQ